MNTASTDKPTVLILGGTTGLLGQAIAHEAAGRGYAVVASSRDDFDTNDSEALAAYIGKIKPDLICNTIAYTQVDKAEEDEKNALLLNRVFPRFLARIVKAHPHIYLMHFSTDFVFNGRKTKPYTTMDEPDPQSVYGKSKLAGEQAILEQNLEKFAIIRTAWLFGPGKKNFVQTILGLSTCRPNINVVFDQIGSPTYTPDLAAYSLDVYEAKGQGLFHIVNSGIASWCDLAAEVVRLSQLECTVNPIPSSEYPQKALRPAYSVLETSRLTEVTGVSPRPWPTALADYIYTITSPL